MVRRWTYDGRIARRPVVKTGRHRSKNTSAQGDLSLFKKRFKEKRKKREKKNLLGLKRESLTMTSVTPPPNAN